MTQSPAAAPHIVDALIEERAVTLRAGPAWPLIKRWVYPALGYRRATAMADEIAELSGRDAMDWAERFLSMTVTASGLTHVPERGACVLTVNHPGGIADGVAVWSALKVRRPDAVFFANRDAIRVCAGLADCVIPVEWRAKARSRDKTRETLRLAIEAFRQDRCVVVFPAGRMARWDWRALRLVEQDWAPTAVSLARKFGAPVVPVGIRQRMSVMFYALGQVHEELKHMTVFHELLAKRGARYRLKLAAPVDPVELPGDDGVASRALKTMSETLAAEAP